MNKELINQSIEYITEHLDEEISVKAVADHFYFSQFYFCRAFKEATGESVYEFIKRLKMEQSAVDMKLEKNRSITDIGLEYGYSSSNYSVAFRKQQHLSPLKFRKSTTVTSKANPFYPEGKSEFDTFNGYAGKIMIQKLPAITVIYERSIGNYKDLKDKWFRFMDKYEKLIKEDTQFIERFYHDPTVTGLNNCLYDICMTTDASCLLENITTIKGGKFAVYRYQGNIRDIFCSVQGVFSIWLPNSGYIMDERYGLNIYQEMNKDHECVIMDLCIPVK